MEHRVVAINSDPESENRMHADVIAREYGFRAGLVPGVDVFEWMARLALQECNPNWLTGGNSAGELKLFKPYYDGETATISTGEDGTLITADDRATLRLFDPSVETNAIAAVPPHAPLSQNRPRASNETLAAGTILGSLHKKLDHPKSSAQKARELLELANRILMRNVMLKPWIHTGSTMYWYPGLAELAEVEVRGEITGQYERKGHGFVAFRLLYCDSQRSLQPVARIDHTAIWRFEKPTS